MLQAQSPGRFAKDTGPGTEFDTRVNLLRTVAMIGSGLFAGSVM